MGPQKKQSSEVAGVLGRTKMLIKTQPNSKENPSKAIASCSCSSMRTNNESSLTSAEEPVEDFEWKNYMKLQGGPLLVVDEVITPVSRIINPVTRL